MSTQNSRDSDSVVQQSLNVYTDTLVIEKQCDGGSRSVVETVPSPDDDNVSIGEMTNEVGKPRVEYPRDRDHCTVSKYKKRKTYKYGSTSFNYEYKQFSIDIDREAHPDEAERLEQVVELVSRLPDIESTVSEIDSYDELVSMEGTVREYEALYELVKSIWSKDSLKSYAIKRTARDFEINQFPQGFYVVPTPHHSTVKQILDDKLQTNDLGFYSLAWGGFIVEPEDFSAVYDIVEPVYHTPDVEPALDP